jgi:hypothetical protein
MSAIVIAIVAWFWVKVRPGSQDTSQPPPVAVAVCGVAGLVMVVSVIVMPLMPHTTSCSGSGWAWWRGWWMRHPLRRMSSRTPGSLTWTSQRRVTAR